MSDYLHIDIETYSSQSIFTGGAYKYAQSADFEIMLLAYALNDQPITVVDLMAGEKPSRRFLKMLRDKSIIKCAHNAQFERRCFAADLDTPIRGQWLCTAVLSSYCGYPLSLAQVSMAMKLGDKGKMKEGKDLIKYFCVPCKPTKKNGGRHRNLPHHDPEKWELFKEYVARDVEAEREIHHRLQSEVFPEEETAMYNLDQIINDRGLLLDTEMAKKAIEVDRRNVAYIKDKMRSLTGVSNPGSVQQLKKYFSEVLGREITSLTKADISDLLEELPESDARDVLIMRKKTAKTSVKKYIKMLQCASDEDDRARGLFQFYGAGKTGRWAGRLIQPQNLPRNYMKNLDEVRTDIIQAPFELLQQRHSDLGDTLSQLTRTALIAPTGKTLYAADFSAIEARVLSWIADEEWRLDVFRTHGMIYEAAAAKMFDLPLEQCTKKADDKNGTSYRSKGKVAELSLGYQGSVGAMTQMGGAKMGLSAAEMKVIVNNWRNNNPKIVQFWRKVEKYAMRAVMMTGREIEGPKGLIFEHIKKGYQDRLTIELPSGRKLFYINPTFTVNEWDKKCLQYRGMIQTINKWGNIPTYGGKLTENIVQAIARDLLRDSMLNLHDAGYNICMHVHDEVVGEIKDDENAEQTLEDICELMGQANPWAEGLPLAADGYLTPYYKKD